jgi:hypothetical protein
MNMNSDQNDIIEVYFDSRNHDYRGTLGEFTINLPVAVKLDANSDYEIALVYLIMDNPYSSIIDSYFLYCDKVQPTRVGTGMANILYKSLPVGVEMNTVNDRFLKISNDSTLIDWKRLNSTSFNTLSFIFESSAGVRYPNGFLPDGLPGLEMKIAIRKSPYQRNMAIL